MTTTTITEKELLTKLRRQSKTISSQKAKLDAEYQTRAELWQVGLDLGLTKAKIAEASGVAPELMKRSIERRS